MFDWWGKGGSVDRLIAKKQYQHACKLLRTQIAQAPTNLRLLQQLAEVLVLDGQTRAAVGIYHHLVDRFAEAGFFAKAIAIAKVIRRVDPHNHVIDEQLRSLVQARDGEAASAAEIKRSLHRESAVHTAAQVAHREELAEILDDLPAGDGDEDLEIELDDPMSTAPEIHSSTLFQGMNENEALAVIHTLQLRTFAAGEIIFSEGEAGSSMFLLASGVVRVYVRNEAQMNCQIRTLEQGEFFGEISLLTNALRSATITAASDCELLELSRDRLAEVANAHPQVATIIEAFCVNRSASAEEMAARTKQSQPPT